MPPKRRRVAIVTAPTAVHKPRNYRRSQEHHPPGYQQMVQVVAAAERRMGVDPASRRKSGLPKTRPPAVPTGLLPTKKKRSRRSSFGVEGTQATNALVAFAKSRTAQRVR